MIAEGRWAEGLGKVFEPAGTAGCSLLISGGSDEAAAQEAWGPNHAKC